MRACLQCPGQAGQEAHPDSGLVESLDQERPREALQQENMAEAKAQAKQKAEDDLLKEAAVARFRRETRKEVAFPFGQRVDEKTVCRCRLKLTFV
ncbi:jg10752 [Pararge aegeria aegeria]|uniref:Jg10752 protein n=1 Tax=Pararge aegeria aegeria TaxID=348720 RepID=A0A8S4RKJ4_9NEOP|nr:jg10752 [Pararge aegeria aegeria]